MGIMRGDLKVLACLVIAYANVVASYNPYSYNARFIPETVSPDSYASMGDIDWVKRSSRYNWYTPNLYSYASMADADWGWKKRTDNSIEEPVRDYLKRAANPYSYHYKYKQPYMRPRPQKDPYQHWTQQLRQWGKRANHPISYLKRANHPMSYLKRANHPTVFYQPYRAYSRFSGSISKPQTRNNLGERQYNYFGMADADWGWKKRSQWPAMLEMEDVDNVDTPDEDIIDNLDLEKRNIGSLAHSNMFPKGHKLSFGKRTDSDESDADENNELFDEEKRHVGSTLRSRRSGIQALVRDGNLPSARARRNGIQALVRDGNLRNN